MSDKDNPLDDDRQPKQPMPAIPLAYNGQTLEGILYDERIPGSLIPSKYLTFASPPKSGSDNYRRSGSLMWRFEDWLEEINACDPLTLDFTLMQLIYPIHQPPWRDFARRRKLPRHVAGDRRDPIALMVTAVQLLHGALPDPRCRRRSLDILRMEYIHDKLWEAELVQVSRRDVRFGALKALNAALGAAIAKARIDCWASLEVL